MTTAPALRRRAAAPALGAALLLGLTACGGGDPLAEEDGSATTSSETVTVGSADFPESQIVETLIEEAMRIAEEMGEPVGGEPGSPTVTVG